MPKFFGAVKENILDENRENSSGKQKLDSQVRLILPAVWSEAEVGKRRDLSYHEKMLLKITSKHSIDLTECLDEWDSQVNSAFT